jgi:LCP family protein required for cell wall assembly
MRVVRVAVGAVSALVLLVTGYGWTAYRELGARLVTSDVLTRDRPSDGVTDILLVGLDSRTDAAGNPLPRELFDALDVGPDQGTLNTDTVILVRIPDEAGLPTTAVSIPRDSYVTIPGFGTHKINSAYARAATAARARLAKQGVAGPALEQQAAQAGRRTLIATVEQLTGVSVDHYAEVNLAGFAEITQAVGGVPVCLNAPVRDSYSGADFAAGPQTLEGPAALAFVRQRHGLPRGDLDRVVRQQAFLASFAHEVLSTGTLADPAQLSGLIAAVGRYVVVDPGWDLLAFAAQARGLTAGAISFRTIPTERPNLATPDDGSAVEIDPGAVRDFVATLSEGTPVGAPPMSAAESAPPAPEARGGPPPSPAAPGPTAPAVAQPITAAGVRCVN